jgi:hypothetical protein
MTHLNTSSAGEKIQGSLKCHCYPESPGVSLRNLTALCIYKFQSFQIKYWKLLYLWDEAEVNISLQYNYLINVHIVSNNKAREDFQYLNLHDSLYNCVLHSLKMDFAGVRKLEIEPRVLCILSRCSNTDLHCWLYCLFLS